MQEVVGDDLLRIATRSPVLKGDRVTLGIDLDELGRKVCLDPVALNDAFEHASELGNTEDPAHPGHVADGALGEDPAAAPGVAREIGGLLRGTRALDGGSWGAEQRAAAFEALNQAAGLVGEARRVIGAGSRARHGPGEPGHEVPGELHPGTEHQDVVVNPCAALGLHEALGGIDGRDRVADPRATWGDEVHLVARAA